MRPGKQGCTGQAGRPGVSVGPCSREWRHSVMPCPHPGSAHACQLFCNILADVCVTVVRGDWVHQLSSLFHVSCSCNSMYGCSPESEAGGMQALMCTAKLIKGVAPHRAKLGDAKVTAASSASTPALQAILQVLITPLLSDLIWLTSGRRNKCVWKHQAACADLAMCSGSLRQRAALCSVA